MLAFLILFVITSPGLRRRGNPEGALEIRRCVRDGTIDVGYAIFLLSQRGWRTTAAGIDPPNYGSGMPAREFRATENPASVQP